MYSQPILGAGYTRCAAALTLVLVVLAACQGASAAPATGPAPITALSATAQSSGRGSGATLTILYWQAPATLNPHLAAALPDLEASRVTYEPLASVDKTGQLVPFLAAEIPSLQNGDVAPDGRSVTWKLRHDVRWSDGAPFTADDVVFTYQFIANPATASPSIGAYAAVSKVEAIDQYTVRVTFKAPNPAWTLPFVGLRGMILPKHVFAAYNGPNARSVPANTMPVGTGPYRVIRFNQREEILLLGTSMIQTNRIVFEPNPYFREADKPYFRRVELKGGATVDGAARMALQSGDVDYARNIQLDAGALHQIGTAGPGKLVATPSPRVERIVLNLTDPNRTAAGGERSSTEYPNPILTDRRVRQAIAYAIDRQAIAKLFSGGQPVYNLLVNPSTYQSPESVYHYDPAMAARLLDEAGWRDTDGSGIREKNGVRLQLTFEAPDDPVRRQMQQIVKDSFAAIGIGLATRNVPSAAFFSGNAFNPDTLEKFAADITEYSRGNETADPGAYMHLWTCDQIPQKANGWAGQNIARWCSPAYMALYQQSTAQLDPGKRQQLFIQMNNLLVQDAAVIPLVRLDTLAGVSNSLEGLDPTPWDGDLWNIKDWRRSSR